MAIPEMINSLKTCRRSPVCTKFWKVLWCYQLCQTTNLTFSWWGLVTKLSESEIMWSSSVLRQSLKEEAKDAINLCPKHWHITTAPPHIKFSQDANRRFFYLSFPQANSPFLECQNGCCGNNRCLNGGTCHETCDVIGTRFACECGLHAIGKYCETGKKS